VAKNKNQSRSQHDHDDQRQNPGADDQMRPSASEVEERIAPNAPHSSRKGQKKFGHN
jgi:hypothetical protein